LQKKNIGITAGFESNIVKKEWIDNINCMDAVIVPSEFTRLSFVNTSNENNKNILTSINVINEWYYNDIDYIDNKNNLIKNLIHKRNILLVGKLSNINNIVDRKNTIKTLVACLEFVKDKNIGVILKASFDSDSVKSKDMLKEYIKDNIPFDLYKDKLSIIVKSLTEKQMISLYSSKNVSCFVSGTRGEGFGLPFLESASLGLPIIATNYSAYKEFLEDDFIKVDYDLIDLGFVDKTFIDEDSNPKWAEFNTLSLKSKLIDFFNNIEKHELIAKKRKKIIKQNLCMSNILDKYNIFFESLE
jgi:glycosyltransferase involved in cell wall biosynthesis